MKKYELVSIQGGTGNYTAVCYNRLGGYYKEFRFLWYSKKAMFYKLRHEYGVIIKRGF